MAAVPRVPSSASGRRWLAWCSRWLRSEHHDRRMRAGTSSTPLCHREQGATRRSPPSAPQAGLPREPRRFARCEAAPVQHRAQRNAILSSRPRLPDGPPRSDSSDRRWLALPTAKPGGKSVLESLIYKPHGFTPKKMLEVYDQYIAGYSLTELIWRKDERITSSYLERML